MMPTMKPLHGWAAISSISNNSGRSWYRIDNATDRADVYIYDDIGHGGVFAGQFLDEVRALKGKPVSVFINSTGGDFFEALGIYNGLRTYSGSVMTQVDSLAASAASIIAQAGDERVMVDKSQMMIHDAWGIAAGGADDMRKYADVLEQVSGSIADIYADHGDLTAGEYRDMMRAETWLSDEAAIEAGLADKILIPQSKRPRSDNQSAPVAGKIDWGKFLNERDTATWL